MHEAKSIQTNCLKARNGWRASPCQREPLWCYKDHTHHTHIKECDLCMDNKSDELNQLFLLLWIFIIWTCCHHTPQSYWWYFKPLGAKLQSRDSGKIRSHNWCTASLNYWIFAHQYNKLPASKSLLMSPKLEWKNKSQVPCRSLIQVGSSVGAKLKSGWDKFAPGCSLGWVCSGPFFFTDKRVLMSKVAAPKDITWAQEWTVWGVLHTRVNQQPSAHHPLKSPFDSVVDEPLDNLSCEK